MMSLGEIETNYDDITINPLVTICVATYNRLSSLMETLKSIENQCYKNTELIIVNDNSTDGTRKFLEKYLIKQTNVKVINNVENKGLAHNRNQGIFNGTGNYYTFLDDDDCLTENALKDYVTAAKQIKSENFIILGGSVKYHKNRKIYYINTFEGSLIDGFKNGLTPPVGAQFFPRKMLVQAFGYNENVKSGVDHDLWVRLLKFNPEIYSLKTCTTISNCFYDSNDRMTKNHDERYTRIMEAFNHWDANLNLISDDFINHFRESYEYYLKMKSLSVISFLSFLIFRFKSDNKSVFVRHYLSTKVNSFSRRINFVFISEEKNPIIHYLKFNSFPKFPNNV